MTPHEAEARRCRRSRHYQFFVGDLQNIPDRLCQTYPWAPSCDPGTVSIRRSMASPGPSAHLNDIDLQRQWLLIADTVAAHLSGWTEPSRCLWGGGAILLAMAL